MADSTSPAFGSASARRPPATRADAAAFERALAHSSRGKPSHGAHVYHGEHPSHHLHVKHHEYAAHHAYHHHSYHRHALHHHHAIRPAGSVAGISTGVRGALDQAMALEGAPSSWRGALEYIVERESGGQVGRRNHTHSARGLFQLTAANYHFNPNGIQSFGDAVEEAQGGIRYIRNRYTTAEHAVAFWDQHGWY